MSDMYTMTTTLRNLWQTAVAKYQAGERDADSYFSAGELAALRAFGHSPREVFDFAEDYVNYGEPDCDTFLLIAAQRVFHYINVMNRQPGSQIVDTGDLPPKTDAVAGIEWLPRIIEKAKAKLRGEMSDDLMYCCGGDRNFFKTHNIHPAEFLQLVSQHMDNDKAVIDWVVARSAAAK